MATAPASSSAPSTEYPPGLRVIEDVITPKQERDIVAWLDRQTWNDTLQRRTQFYGYDYGYYSHESQKTTPISGPLLDLLPVVEKYGHFTAEQREVDLEEMQCIVNEYTRDQGIAAHTDAKVFGPVVIGISLLSPVGMIFTRGEAKVEVYLPRRSLFVMEGESRTKWKHCIPKRKTVSMLEGKREKKEEDYRRISLTYRTVLNKSE